MSAIYRQDTKRASADGHTSNSLPRAASRAVPALRLLHTLPFSSVESGTLACLSGTEAARSTSSQSQMVHTMNALHTVRSPFLYTALDIQIVAAGHNCHGPSVFRGAGKESTFLFSSIKLSCSSFAFTSAALMLLRVLTSIAD